MASVLLLFEIRLVNYSIEATDSKGIIFIVYTCNHSRCARLNQIAFALDKHTGPVFVTGA